jgi:hypothetical protein
VLWTETDGGLAWFCLGPQPFLYFTCKYFFIFYTVGEGGRGVQTGILALEKMSLKGQATAVKKIMFKHDKLGKYITKHYQVQ